MGYQLQGTLILLHLGSSLPGLAARFLSQRHAQAPHGCFPSACLPHHERLICSISILVDGLRRLVNSLVPRRSLCSVATTVACGCTPPKPMGPWVVPRHSMQQGRRASGPGTRCGSYTARAIAATCRRKAGGYVMVVVSHCPLGREIVKLQS